MKDSKKMRLHIGSIVKKMERHAINFDHPLQRASEQWSPVMKGNLISDILQENPIPDLVFAEQEIHEAPITWGIDGKQRCTNIRDFINNDYSVSKNVDRYMIEYAVPVLDEDGVQMRDEDGIVIHKTEVCDIRGKRFKTLPRELQERILDYGFDIVLYYDCSEENLAYHIKRYNEGRAMNAEQKGITRIGTHFASVVKNISSMAFFEDGVGKFTKNQFKNGKIYRIIVESVMTTRFLDNWFKDYGEICEYIKENATDEDFEEFRSLVESLEDMVEPSVGQMFDSKYSFLWFGLYSRFVKLGIDEDKFNDFMLELNKGIPRDESGKILAKEPMSGLCVEEIDGMTFEGLLNNSSTKDTNVVKARIDFLTRLMCNYFEIDVPNLNEGILKRELENFVEEFVSAEIPHNTRETALKTLMQFTNYPTRDFSGEGVADFEHWLTNGSISQDTFEDCMLGTSNLADYLKGAGVYDKFSANDIAILIHRVYADGEDLDQDAFELWLDEFENTNHCETSGSNNALLEKECFMKNNYEKFIKENSKGE